MNKSKAFKYKWLMQLIGIMVTLLCLYIMAQQINFTEVLNAFQYFKWSYLILGIASLICGYSLRIFRWSLMLNATGALVTFRNCVAPFLGTIALNNVLPLRMGDLIRAFIFPNEMRLSRSTATSSLLMERLIDLMTLLVCFAIGLIAIQTKVIPKILYDFAVIMVFIGGLILLLVFFFSGHLANIFQRFCDETGHLNKNRLLYILVLLVKSLRSFEAMARPRILFLTLLISMLIWIGESGMFYFILLGFGLNAHPTVALLVMSIATLSTLIPSSPGYIGSFHLAAFTAISLVGGNHIQAGSYAVLSHLTLWVPTTVVGAVAICLRPSLFRITRTEQISELKTN